MPRIHPLDPNQAEGKAKTLLDGARESMGMVPNVYATMANSPAVLEAYVSFHKAMGGASLGPVVREQIALTVAGANGCDYCASAHSTIGAQLGITSDELARNLLGVSNDPKTQAALDFAKAILQSEGWVSDDALQAVRDAEYTEGEIAEIIAAVALNIFSTYFNHIAGTDVDFPYVSSGKHPTVAR